MSTVEIHPVHASGEVKALLAASELPTDDLEDPSIALYGASEAGRLIGVVGVQVLGRAGLLRSLAVDPAARDRGLGGQLCERVLQEARARGLTELWLLTTTARDYFARRAFEVVPRDQAPSALRSTAQFMSLCPASAVVMRRSL